MAGLKGFARIPNANTDPRVRRQSSNLADDIGFIDPNEVITLTAAGILSLKLKSDGGLANVAGELSALLNPTDPGLVLAAAGLSVLIDSNGGLESVAAGIGLRREISTQTANYTILTSDETVLGAPTSANITFTLPLANVTTGHVLWLKKTDNSVHEVTVDGNGSETIDDALTQSLLFQFDRIGIVSDGTEYHIISENREAGGYILLQIGDKLLAQDGAGLRLQAS